MTGDDVPSHKCTQGVTMTTICNKVENIEAIIAEMKESQKEDMKWFREFQQKFEEKLDLQKKEMEAIRLNSARYPSPEVVGSVMSKVVTHDTYFAIGGAGLLAAWGFLLWIADKLWKG